MVGNDLHAIAHPREDDYGIHLFSRFPLIGPEVRFLVEDYVPSIKTGLRLPSGRSQIIPVMIGENEKAVAVTGMVMHSLNHCYAEPN